MTRSDQPVDAVTQEPVDLVIVGCGAGGLATGVEFLAQAGPHACAVLLERSDRAGRGGNTAWTAAFFRLESDGTPAADFVDRMTSLSDGRTDPAIISRLASDAPNTIAWLAEQGVHCHTDHTYFLTSRGPRLMPHGGGASIVESLAAKFEEAGGRIVYEQTAVELLLDHDGRVAGVLTRSEDGLRTTWPATTVVLASGGFQGSAKLLTRHLGARGDELTPIAPGGRSNRGEGIEMAIAAGAAVDGQFDAFHGEPVDARTRSAEALVMVYPYGILVDHRAQRFLDEGSDTPDNTFEDVAHRIWRDADQFAYVIADAKLTGQDIARAVLTDKAPESADSIGALARRLGLDPDALQETVSQFNAACTPGPLSLTVADGVSTTGLTIPKSNWARPLDTPPYSAWPVRCAITFTFGGLRTDAGARVLDGRGDPLPGLLAVGEVAGIYHGRYPGATSVLRALVFGRIAGAAAASELTSETRTAGVS